MSGTWGAYMQNNDFEQIDKVGAALNLHLHCAVHYPAYNKRLFECSCNMLFPVWQVEAAIKTGNWEIIDARHRGEI
jgi:hypothetical protein